LSSVVPVSVAKADVLFCDSDFTRQRILHHFPESAAKPCVPLGVPAGSPQFMEAQTAQPVLAKYGLRPQAYIFSLSTIAPHKNYGRLIEAYKALPAETREQFSLIIAGGVVSECNNLSEEAQSYSDSIAPGRIILPGYISDEEKAALYRNARLFVFPSLYEGFGIPLLEAMNYNVDIIASDIPIFREIAEDAVVFFNPQKADELANCMQKALEEEEEGEKRRQRYAPILNKYSWENVAQQVLKTLSEYHPIYHEQV
jgi:alpha-1,3-rhamnosyl/mannosyltransferase